MTFPLAIILGVVQGVAEFLPISSSGHLSLLQYFFGMENNDNLFNILLHFATLIAVCVAYRRDIGEMILEFFRAIGDMVRGRTTKGNPPEARRMILLIILGTLPLFLVVLVKDRVEALGNNPTFVSCALLVTGFILFFSDRMAQGHKTVRTATVKDVLLVGVAQAIGTIPGISRSGITISTGMARGFDRKFAVRFSFLMSLPAVLGANILKVGDAALPRGLSPGRCPFIGGRRVAAVVGFFLPSKPGRTLSASKGKFGVFAYYCWVVGLWLPDRRESSSADLPGKRACAKHNLEPHGSSMPCFSERMDSHGH